MDERYFNCPECGRMVGVSPEDDQPRNVVYCPNGHIIGIMDAGWAQRLNQQARDELIRNFGDQNG